MKNNFAGVAQLVELLTCNEEVARSIRVASFNKINIGQVPKWPKGTDCKSVALVLQRFESSPAHFSLKHRYNRKRLNKLKGSRLCGCSSMVEQ